MKFSILCDANWDAKISEALDDFSGLRRYFEEKYYYSLTPDIKNYCGSSIDAIVIVFMCRNPEYNFKQRIRFSKKVKTLYIDIMLDYNLFIQIDQGEKKKIIAQRLLTEVPSIIARYKFPDFDLPKFESDMKMWLKKHRLS